MVVDGDLGISGRFRRAGAEGVQAAGRAGCAWGRSARSSGWRSRGWRARTPRLQRLLEFCALTDTLVVDTDGIYDLQDFNDRLLLGLKAQMSEAELHMITSRLQGAKRAAAERGELRFPLPVGYVHDEEGQTIIDPDEEVQAAIATCSARLSRPARPTAWSACSRAGGSRSAPMAGRGRASCAGVR